MTLNFNLRHLRAVGMIAREGSISAAAGMIGLSQPALTQGLAKLERQFGVRLFDRLPGHLTPTANGEQVLARIERALALFAGEGGAPPDAGRRGRRLERHMTASHVRALLLVAGSDAGRDPGMAPVSALRLVVSLQRIAGAALLERRAGGMELTDSGRAMARHFSLGMTELDLALQEVLQRPARIVVGAMALSRSRLIPEALAVMSARAPEIEIDVVDGSYGELVDALRSGSIDMLIGTLRDHPGADLRQEVLLRDRITVIGRTAHPLANIQPSLAELARFPWIVGRRTSALLERWQQIFDEAGVPRPHAPIHCGSVTVIRSLLFRSDFLTLLSRDQIQAELEAGLLAVIASEIPETIRIVGAITRRDWHPSRAQNDFRLLLHHVATRMQDGADD